MNWAGHLMILSLGLGIYIVLLLPGAYIKIEEGLRVSVRIHYVTIAWMF